MDHADLRERIREGRVDRRELRRALTSAPFGSRDAWLDRLLGLGELPDDGPELPRDCVPYLPCSVDVLLRAVDDAEIREDDIVVDVGAGIGRAAACVGLITGAEVIGIEIQPALVEVARAVTEGLGMSRVSFLEGDAVELSARLPGATVFFLYCPFGAPRVARWLAALEPIARSKPLRICCVDLTLPPRAWLTCTSNGGELAIYRSVPDGV